MRRVRVAHVITRLCQGGAQQNTFHSVRCADPDRFDVDLISGPVPPGEVSMEDEILASGIRIEAVESLCRRPSPLRDAATYFRLVSLFRKRSYDIVHTHTSKAGFIGRLAARRAGTPIVVHTPHGNIFHGYFSKPVTALFIGMERYAAGMTDRLITLTERGVEEHLAERIGRPEQYASIFSGIDFGPFDDAMKKRDETRAALGISPDELLIGGVGRLEPIKGFRYFIEAAHKIHKAAPKARFILAGQGSCEDELAALAEPLGDSFRLLGQRNDVPRIMAAMDILVAPSVNEGMGRVLLEAGAAHKACVASAVGGIPDILEEGVTGLLVAPEDAAALAEAVVALLRDQGLREAMGEAAQRKTVARYGVEKMVRQIEDLYEALILEKGLTELSHKGGPR